MTKAKGFMRLPGNSEVAKHSFQPGDVKVVRNGYGYYSYGKYEPQAVAIRFAAIHVAKKLPVWMAMSLKRFLAGQSRLTAKLKKAYPSRVPKLTDAQMQGSDVEIIPPPPGWEYANRMCGLRWLEKLGVIKIKTIKGEHYLVPTKKFVDDFKSGYDWVEEHYAKQKRAA